MDYAEGTQGRVFVLRLYGGEILHEKVEEFARMKGISEAAVTAVGGADAGSRMTVGPEVPAGRRITPIVHELDAPHEFTGTGTIFPDARGTPVLHMHCSCGREGRSVTGCVRAGISVWLVMEVVITEISTGARRMPDAGSGFDLLVPRPEA